MLSLFGGFVKLGGLRLTQEVHKNEVRQQFVEENVEYQ